MEETPNPTSQEAGKSVLGPVIWQEVLRKVIAPKVAVIVTQYGNDIENRQQLHRKFCEEYGIRPSYSTFSSWCEDLGISFRKKIEVHIPGWKEMPRPNAEFIGPMPVAVAPVVQQDEDPDAPVQWDTAPVREIPLEAFNDNMPTILPGGFRAPTFLGDNNFGN
jgi:hypothetical protein